MSRRTFNLQMHDRPLRWLPHMHTCSDCGQDYACEYDGLSGWCKGLVRHVPHSGVCPRSVWNGIHNDNDIIDDLRAMMRSRRHVQPAVIGMPPRHGKTFLNNVAADLAANLASALNDSKLVHAVHNDDGTVTITPGTQGTEDIQSAIDAAFEVYNQ